MKASKRKSVVLDNPRPSKRSKIVANEGEAFIVPFEIPEIFALVGSFLIQKPVNFANLSRVNSRTHKNALLASVWQQLGFRALATAKIETDPQLISSLLQNLEYQRTLQKSFAIQRKLASLKDTKYIKLSKEAKNTIESKLDLDSNLPDEFYKEILANSILTDEHLTAMGKMIAEEPELVFVRVIFDAFKLVLSHSKTEIEKMAFNFGNIPKVNDYYDVSESSISPGLQRPFAVTSDMASANRKKFLQNLFIVCHAKSKYVGNEVNLLQYSCFIKFIDDAKVVIFVAQYTDYQCFDYRIHDTAAFVHYWKLDLTTKSVMNYGSIHELGEDIELSEEDDEPTYTRLIYSMNTVLECDLEEVYEDSNMSPFLQDCCCGKLLRYCLRDDTWGQIESKEDF